MKQEWVRFYRSTLGFTVLFCRRALEVVGGFGPCCRFTPTCSLYAKVAVERFGWIRGSVCAIRRLLKCQFWGPMGLDPVPGGSKNGI